MEYILFNFKRSLTLKLIYNPAKPEFDRAELSEPRQIHNTLLLNKICIDSDN